MYMCAYARMLHECDIDIARATTAIAIPGRARALAPGISNTRARVLWDAPHVCRRTRGWHFEIRVCHGLSPEATSHPEHDDRTRLSPRPNSNSSGQCLPATAMAIQQGNHGQTSTRVPGQKQAKNAGRVRETFYLAGVFRTAAPKRRTRAPTSGRLAIG